MLWRILLGLIILFVVYYICVTWFFARIWGSVRILFPIILTLESNGIYLNKSDRRRFLGNRIIINLLCVLAIFDVFYYFISSYIWYAVIGIVLAAVHSFLVVRPSESASQQFISDNYDLVLTDGRNLGDAFTRVFSEKYGL